MFGTMVRTLGLEITGSIPATAVQPCASCSHVCFDHLLYILTDHFVLHCFDTVG